MEPTLGEIRKIHELSDTVLYPEAVAFIKQLTLEDSDPIPPSQIMGLLSIANSHTYADLYKFVTHQRDRDWSQKKENIKVFYTNLEKYLTGMRLRRLKEELHLVREGLDARQAKLMAEDIMKLLAQDFIQHLAAENNRLVANTGEGQNHGRRQR